MIGASKLVACPVLHVGVGNLRSERNPGVMPVVDGEPKGAVVTPITTRTRRNRTFFRNTTEAPLRQRGSITVGYELWDQEGSNTRRAWSYNPGTRRVRQMPAYGFGQPIGPGGFRTVDDDRLFNGSGEPYTWNLVGRKELYIPYHNYMLMTDTVKYKDLLARNHANPDFMRYELHRVWVLEAALTPGYRHQYAKRVLYVDEDTWQAVMAAARREPPHGAGLAAHAAGPGLYLAQEGVRHHCRKRQPERCLHAVLRHGPRTWCAWRPPRCARSKTCAMSRWTARWRAGSKRRSAAPGFCSAAPAWTHAKAARQWHGSAVPDAIACSAGYAVSQQKRKLIEQGFGWVKTVGGMRQVMVRGLKKVDQMFVLSMAAFNLVRMRSLGQIRPQLQQSQ